MHGQRNKKKKKKKKKKAFAISSNVCTLQNVRVHSTMWKHSYKYNNTLQYSTSGTRLKGPTAFPSNKVKP